MTKRLAVTPRQAAGRSVLLLGVTTLTLLGLGLLNRSAVNTLRAQAAEAATTQKQHEQLVTLAELQQQYGDSVLEAVRHSVPAQLDLPAFFVWLDAQAVVREVTVAYNFTSFQQEEGERVLGQRTVAVDFHGSALALQSLLDELETGLYHLNITSLEFDVTDPAASQLKLQLALFGGPDV